MVNNAIVLIDVIDSNLDAGMSSADAVVEAVARRTRPILLTTLTTVAGLAAPDFHQQHSCGRPWPGRLSPDLLAATVLTLGVVPTLSNWLLKPRVFIKFEFLQILASTGR